MSLFDNLCYHIRSVTESSPEAFVLRLYREANSVSHASPLSMSSVRSFSAFFQTGFIRAFTTSAEALTGSSWRLAKIMQNLQVRRLLLYPRSACRPPQRNGGQV